MACLVATIPSMAVETNVSIQGESLAQLPIVDILFLHGYIEQPIVGPSLPDANTIFVADAAMELIKARKVKQVVISTKCDFGDPEHNLSIAEKIYHYMQARLGEKYKDFPIFASPVANTTIKEIEQLNQLVAAGTQDGELVKTFAELCFDPHTERVSALRQHIIDTKIAEQIPLYTAGDILALSEDEATRQYAAQFRQSEGYAAFALREETYRRLLRYPWLGVPLMKAADRIQGNGKFLAAKGYEAALRQVRRAAATAATPTPDSK